MRNSSPDSKSKSRLNWSEPNWRRYLLLKLLRILNFLALILALWPLILITEWIDRRSLVAGLWPSAMITIGLGLVALLAMLPLQIKQRSLRRAEEERRQELERDLETVHTEARDPESLKYSANLSDLEDILYPVDETQEQKKEDRMGRHSAHALNEEDAYKKWKRENRQYYLSRIMGTVGINVIRALLMLVFALLLFGFTYSIGLTTAVSSGICALLLVMYCFDLPHRSYGDIFKNAHLTAHIIMVVVIQLIRHFMSFPLQPDFHLYILFYIIFIYFLTRNQTNIDSLMHQGSRSLSELPHGLRGFNAGLTSLLTLAFPLIYIMRKPIAAVLNFLWDLLIFVITSIINFINSLLPPISDGVEETVASSASGQEPLPAASESYWLRTIMTALVITIAIYILRRYGRQMLNAIGQAFRKIIAWIAALFHREVHESSDVEEGRYYTDYHMALDPKQKQRTTLRARKKQWKRAYSKYRKRYQSVDREHKLADSQATTATAATTTLTTDVIRYRQAYRLALAWLDLQEEEGLNPAETVREIAHAFEPRLAASEITDPEHFEAVTTAYEDLRYGEEKSFDAVDGIDHGTSLDELEAQLKRMAAQL